MNTNVFSKPGRILNATWLGMIVAGAATLALVAMTPANPQDKLEAALGAADTVLHQIEDVPAGEPVPADLVAALRVWVKEVGFSTFDDKPDACRDAFVGFSFHFGMDLVEYLEAYKGVRGEEFPSNAGYFREESWKKLGGCRNAAA